MFYGVFSRNLIKINSYFGKSRFLSAVHSQINSKTHHF